VQIHLTAMNAKSEPASELVAEFARVFKREPVEAIEYAFRAWRDESPFFPSVYDIREKVRAWHRAKADEERAHREHEERKQNEAARQKGNLYGFADVLAQFRKKHPDLEAPQPVAGMAPIGAALHATPPSDYEPPSREELERRRNAQVAAVQSKYPDRSKA